MIHVWGVSAGWRNGSFPGNEFRQTQTAISALFIQKENNFSPAYPTPVLGKPWSIPMEFPLYQWSVVALSNSTGLSLISAGRAVSALCFYLALPALYLLLRRTRLDSARCLLVLGLVLSCPLYIFYSRGFLIETMALMSGLWYLLALVESTRGHRHTGWLVAAALMGTAAGLVKITTFIFFLLPAFAWCMFLLWRDRPRAGAPDSWRPFARTFAWLALLHSVPFLVSLWWIDYSDAIKLRNPAGAFLASGALQDWNFGHGVRFSSALWAEHGRILVRDIAHPVVLAAGLLAAALCIRRFWPLLVGCLVPFAAVQVMFPILYAWHDYYYVAIAFALMLALGFALIGAAAALRLPGWAALLLFVGVHSAQLRMYAQHHLPQQTLPSSGGTQLTALLRDYTAPDDVMIIAGEDWSSMIPYYTQRRSLMLPVGRERDWEYVDRALAELEAENVTVLLLSGAQRDNYSLLERARDRFDMGAEQLLTWNGVRVFFRRDRGDDLRRHLEKGPESFGYGGVFFADEPPVEAKDLTGQILPYDEVPLHLRPAFRTMEPRPVRYFSTVGPEVWEEPGLPLRFFAHPETRLWFSPEAGSRRLRTVVELGASTYADLPQHEASDGVELTAVIVHPDGERAEVGRRRLNPRDVLEDRGPQPIDWSFQVPAGAELELAVTSGPDGNSARDWATLEQIVIE